MATRYARRRSLRGPQGEAEVKAPHGARGPTDPPGPRGPTGPIGRRGEIGKPGSSGPRGVTGPPHDDHVLEIMMTHFDDVYHQLDIQMKQIAQIQQHVDMLIANARTKA